MMRISMYLIKQISQNFCLILESKFLTGKPQLLVFELYIKPNNFSVCVLFSSSLLPLMTSKDTKPRRF